MKEYTWHRDLTQKHRNTEKKDLLPSSSQPWQWKNHTFVDDFPLGNTDVLFQILFFWTFFHCPAYRRFNSSDWIGMARPRRCRPPLSRPLDTGPSPPLQSATPIPVWAPAPRRPDVVAAVVDGGPAVAAEAPGRPRSSQNLEVETSNGKTPYGDGSIPIDTFLVGWTSIYQLFWGSLGTRVLTHPHMNW